jgi:hypothetical protein
MGLFSGVSGLLFFRLETLKRIQLHKQIQILKIPSQQLATDNKHWFYIYKNIDK